MQPRCPNVIALYRTTAHILGAVEAWRTFTTRAKELRHWEPYHYTEVAALQPCSPRWP